MTNSEELQDRFVSYLKAKGYNSWHTIKVNKYGCIVYLFKKNSPNIKDFTQVKRVTFSNVEIFVARLSSKDYTNKLITDGKF